MSSGSESDDDYVPEEPVQVSEEDSADDDTDLQYENELEQKNKRKSAQKTKAKKKMKSENGKKEITETVGLPQGKEECENPEEEKKREDDLWAKFLEGTDTKPTSTANEPINTQSPITQPSESFKSSNSLKDQKLKEDEKDREKRIFEFAGETIVVENNIIKERIKAVDSPASVSKLQSQLPRGRKGGLSNILSAINKKNTLSTLEKSKLDWETMKKEEGIEEEIVNHNKGKAGYLDRQDFLERTDVRQYEIERDLRLSRRSNR